MRLRLPSFLSARPAAGTDVGDPAGLPSRPRLSLWALVFLAVLILGGWACVLLMLNQQRGEALQGEVRQNGNLASVLQEQTLRVLATADQSLQRIGESLRSSGSGTPDLARMATETGLAPRILVQLSLVSPTGEFVASNLDPDGSQTGHIDLSAREHIQPHLGAHPASGNAVFIGKPVLGKVSQRWTVQLSRRLTDANGRTLGIAVASLDPVYFEGVYRQMDLGPRGSVSLVGTDLRVRARVTGGQPGGMGSDLPADHPLARQAWQASGWQIEARTEEDPTDRIVAYRRVGDYPLYVTVSTAAADAFAEWHGLRNLLLLLGTLGTLLMLLLGSIFLRRLRELEQGHEAMRLQLLTPLPPEFVHTQGHAAAHTRPSAFDATQPASERALPSMLPLPDVTPLGDDDPHGRDPRF